MTTETTKAKKIRILDDVKVEADLSNMVCHKHYKDQEEFAKDLENVVKDFKDFLGDHRSQDRIILFINKFYQEVCSSCKCKWEVERDENNILRCAGCGAEIEEQL